MSRLAYLIFFAVLCTSNLRAAESQHVEFVGDAKVFSAVAIAEGTVQYKPPFLKVVLDDAVARRTELQGHDYPV
jgi:hypothetical protein